MKRLLFVIPLLVGGMAVADTMTLNDGTTLRGQFTGFSNGKFAFKTDDGSTRLEYAIHVKSIIPDSLLRVSLQLLQKQYDAVVFSQFDHNTLRLRKDDQSVSEPVIMLKGLSVLGPVNPSPREEDSLLEETPGPTSSPAGRNTREWKRTGKWREIEDDKSMVISNGEVVDLEAALKKGVVNVIHFHYPRAVSSVRDGNYLVGIATKHPNRLVVKKVVVQDFNAPICQALELKTLPQFWFYGPGGKLAKKLTERFTENDLDAALRDAARR